MPKTKRGPGRPRVPVPREEMLARAAEAFAESGYAGTSVSTIAARVGVTKASLFHHFPTKEALYIEALQGMLADLGGIVADAGMLRGTFAERLDRLGDLVVDYLSARPVVARLLLRELVDHGPFLRGPGGAVVTGTLQAVAAFFEAGMDAGEFTRRDPGQLAVSVTGLHLYYFAAAVTVADTIGDVFDPALVDARRAAVRDQVRALCLV